VRRYPENGDEGFSARLGYWLGYGNHASFRHRGDVTFQSTDGTGNLSGSFFHDTAEAPITYNTLAFGTTASYRPSSIGGNI
jgi:hypothetical protein